MSEFKKVKVEDLKIGPIRHHTLNPAVLEAVDLLYQQIGPYIGSREVFETNLMRDMHPEREMMVWGRISQAWKKYHVLHLDSKLQDHKTEEWLVGQFIGISCGCDREGSPCPTEQEWQRMQECYNDPTLPIAEDGQHRHGN